MSVLSGFGNTGIEKSRHLMHFVVIFFAVFLCTAANAREEQKSLRDIRITREEDRYIILIQAGGPITRFHFSSLPKPYRFVADLPGKWKKPSKNRFIFQSDLAKRARTGLHPDHLRIVFDLAENMVIQPEIRPVPEGLSLIIRDEHIERLASGENAGDAASAQAKGLIRKISIMKKNNEEHLIIETDKPAPDAKAFMVEESGRKTLAVDIAGAWKRSAEKKISAEDASWVRQVRTGIHPDYFRVAIDLGTEPVLYKTQTEDHIISVILSPETENGPASSPPPAENPSLPENLDEETSTPAEYGEMVFPDPVVDAAPSGAPPKEEEAPETGAGREHEEIMEESLPDEKQTAP